MPYKTNFTNGEIFSYRFLKMFILFCAIVMPWVSFAQNAKNDSGIDEADKKLLNQFIQSKGNGIITFDASNIKQFWVDNSVIARKDCIELFLKNGSSIPLKLQLANVSGAQNCKIEVITETPDTAFTVSDMKLKQISSSSHESSFINNDVLVSSFSLEDTLIDRFPQYHFCFQLSFKARNCESIRIKAIVLSFSDNENVISTPSGILNLTEEDVNVQRAVLEKEDQNNSFSVTGKISMIKAKKSIFVADKDFNVSVKVKNTGASTTRVYVGYIVYSDKYVPLYADSYPYNNINKILNVISSEKGSNSIIVDSYPEWKKGLIVSLNAKEDLSDIPSFLHLDGAIEEVKELKDGRAEIIMNKAISNELKHGDKIRINGGFGGTYIYSGVTNLQPGREEVFTHTIKQDNSFLQYSKEAFARGIFYFRPLILSYSLDSKEDNTIQIIDYTIQW